MGFESVAKDDLLGKPDAPTLFTDADLEKYRGEAPGNAGPGPVRMPEQPTRGRGAAGILTPPSPVPVGLTESDKFMMSPASTESPKGFDLTGRGNKTPAEFAKTGGIFTNAQLPPGSTGAAASTPVGIDTSAFPAIKGIDMPGLPFEDPQSRNNREVGERNAAQVADYDRRKFIEDITWRAKHAAQSGDKAAVKNYVEMLGAVLPQMDKAGIDLTRSMAAGEQQNKFYKHGIEWNTLASTVFDRDRQFGMDTAKFEAGKPLTEAQTQEAAAKAGLLNAQAKTETEGTKGFFGGIPHELYGQIIKASIDPSTGKVNEDIAHSALNMLRNFGSQGPGSTPEASSRPTREEFITTLRAKGSKLTDDILSQAYNERYGG